MNKVVLEDAMLQYLLKLVHSSVVPIDDLGNHFQLLAALQKVSKEEAAPVPAPTPEPKPEPEPQVDTSATTPLIAVPEGQGELLSINCIRQLFKERVRAERVPQDEIASIVLHTPEGYYIFSDGTIVKKAPPGFGSCIQFVYVENYITTQSLLGNSAISTSLEMVPDSHYVIHRAGTVRGGVELDKYTADIVYAFMHYHRNSMT